MSLKTFHLVFITLAILISIGFGVWGILSFIERNDALELSLGILSLLIAITLVIYERSMFKKLHHIRYL